MSIRREKSDAQLDAEASGREWSLDELIALHRKLQHDDLYIEKLATVTPPVTVDPNTGKRGSGEASELGMTLSWALQSYLDGQYGSRFPWARAFMAQRRECRERHVAHNERPEFRGSLCHELVSLVIIGDYSLDQACLRIGLTPERSGRVLRHALVWIERKMDEYRQMQEHRSAGLYTSIGIPERPHRPLGGLHAEDCHNPICKEERAA